MLVVDASKYWSLGKVNRLPWEGFRLVGILTPAKTRNSTREGTTATVLVGRSGNSVVE